MERASALDEFLRRPVGRFLVGRSWVYGCERPELFRVVLFQRPDRDDIAQLVRALSVELGEGIVPHRSLVDAGRLDGADAGAFAGLQEYVRANHAILRQRVTRLALVHGGGLPGAVVAGFYNLLDAPYPVKRFAETRAALRWLGEPEGTPDRFESIVAEVLGTDSIVSALRALLAGRRELTVDAACRTLAISARTLQRRLRDAGTTFQREVVEARLRDAERRMLDTLDPLTTIALDCGFGSPQHFSAQFRRARGSSPSAWRVRHRR
jgi:AraC-like DNA-binding protein